MKRLFSYLIVLLCLMPASSCHRKDRVIPRDKMARIYAEIFLLDEQIDNQRQWRRMADTSKVYEAVFEKYGYTAEDYRRSQEKYILDADRYTRILKKSVKILEKEKALLEEEKKKLDALAKASNNSKRFAPHRIYLMDTLGRDSLLNFDFQKGLDTAYRGPEMIVWADTLKAYTDSLMRADSLRHADSLRRADSLENLVVKTRRKIRRATF